LLQDNCINSVKTYLKKLILKFDASYYTTSRFYQPPKGAAFAHLLTGFTLHSASLSRISIYFCVTAKWLRFLPDYHAQLSRDIALSPPT